MFRTIATAALAVSFAGAAMADEKFNSATLLSQPKENQLGFINASVAMASAMVSPTQAQCIINWAKQNSTDDYSLILSTMKKFAEYHPAGVIAAMLEKACGRFELAKN